LILYLRNGFETRFTRNGGVYVLFSSLIRTSAMDIILEDIRFPGPDLSTCERQLYKSSLGSQENTKISSFQETSADGTTACSNYNVATSRGGRTRGLSMHVKPKKENLLEEPGEVNSKPCSVCIDIWFYSCIDLLFDVNTAHSKVMSHFPAIV
jgi:hypothetical protein